KSEGSGTGLGLHICKEIIESLKGSISYSQAEPNGAHFKITLPENL
ncbi:MAG: ATP-binding protein, partial [Lentisphaeraceae bacterium]|nr:ATP-binding protein [Lentisphaeraceae bacterium]